MASIVEHGGGVSEPLTPGWAAKRPEDLLADGEALLAEISLVEAWKAIRYGRNAGDSYDEIAFRTAAATPCRRVPLETIARMLHLRERDHEAARLTQQQLRQASMRHRAIDLPPDDGRYRYQITNNTMEFFLQRHSAQGVAYEERWLLGRNHPPSILSRDAQPRDSARTFNQQYSTKIPGARWVPFPLLVEAGKMRRRQEWDERLFDRVESGVLYLFVSHRWRTPLDPDPDGGEASLLAWQLMDYLCEAVLVATRRGLHEPRLYSDAIGQYIGLSGRDLAESMIVNVLRRALDHDALKRAAEEAATIEPYIVERGLATAQRDIGLGLLRALLSGCPELRRLSQRICLWYDFGCLPQSPRTAAEQSAFDEALRFLDAIQLMGRTAVLIDRPENYLARAWCTLEALAVNASNGDLDLLHADIRSTTIEGEMERYFHMVMHDRPYVVRRAVLDTLLFRIQSSTRCLERLGLAFNEPSDLPYLFQTLARQSHTFGIHVDDSAIITGALPLAPLGSDHVVFPTSGQRIEPIVDAAGSPTTLEAWRALVIFDEDLGTDIPAPHVTFDVPDSPTRCHVIICAGCEGDCVLLAQWVHAQRAALEEVLDVSIVAVSWVSEDIAPVGHMACGRLQPVVVDADIWLIIAPRVFLDHGTLAPRLLAVADEAGLERAVLVVDEHERNLYRLSAMPHADGHEAPSRVARAHVDFEPIDGGIFTGAVRRGVPLFRIPQATECPPIEDLNDPPEHLHVMLVNAVHAHPEHVETICRSFPRTIHEQFDGWRKVPEQLRGEPQLVRGYVHAMMVIAQTMQKLGWPRIIEMLTSPAENPITRYHSLFRRAEKLGNEGDYATSNEVLSKLLDELAQVSGTAADELRPKVLGLIGANWFRLGRTDVARTATRRALEECLRVGDEAGVATYQENLRILASEQETEAIPLEEIAKAQELSDRGRYEASNALLATLAIDMTQSWAAKVLGLRAMNEYWLGDRSNAAAHTQQAIACAAARGDSEGIRVYRHNLTRITSG